MSQTPLQQIEDILQAERDLQKELERRRFEGHEEGAKANDELIRLQLGRRQ